MAKTVTPSAVSKLMTAGQITKVTANFRALLEKHATEFDSEAVQQVLGDSALAGEMFALFRARVEAISNMIIRRVPVNRRRTPQEVLDATGRKQYTDKDVVGAMPHGEGEEVEVCFFNLGRDISDTDLDKEYEVHGLEPADPYSLAAVNEADPALADNNPNCTHWKDSRGKWCYVAFYRWYGVERRVGVDRGGGWGGRWWFAGLRKVSKKPLDS